MKSQNLLTKFKDMELKDVSNFHHSCEALSQIDAIHHFLTSSGKSMTFGPNCPIVPYDLLQLTGYIIDLINLKVKEHYEKVSQNSENNMDCD